MQAHGHGASAANRSSTVVTRCQVLRRREVRPHAHVHTHTDAPHARTSDPDATAADSLLAEDE